MDIFDIYNYISYCLVEELNIVSISVRLILAMVLGGAIGIERGSSNHSAGFRTHILVCMGATIAMLTNEYICEYVSPTADPARLGAQVITGVGFLGAGSIFATGKHKIKGLTTAAGLWASATVGLAIGVGFYSGAIMGTILIYVSLALLPSIEAKLLYNARLVNLYIELDSIHSYNRVIGNIKGDPDIEICDSYFSNSEPLSKAEIGVHLSLKLKKRCIKAEVIEKIRNTNKEIILLDEI